MQETLGVLDLGHLPGQIGPVALQIVEHDVDVRGQGAQFVPAPQGHPSGKVPGRAQAPDLGRQAFEPGQHAPFQQEHDDHAQNRSRQDDGHGVVAHHIVAPVLQVAGHVHAQHGGRQAVDVAQGLVGRHGVVVQFPEGEPAFLVQGLDRARGQSGGFGRIGGQQIKGQPGAAGQVGQDLVVHEPADDQHAARIALLLAGKDGPRRYQQQTSTGPEQARDRAGRHGRIVQPLPRNQQGPHFAQEVGIAPAVDVKGVAPYHVCFHVHEDHQIEVLVRERGVAEVGIVVALVVVGDEAVGVVPGRPVQGEIVQALEQVVQGEARPLHVASGRVGGHVLEAAADDGRGHHVLQRHQDETGDPDAQQGGASDGHGHGVIGSIPPVWSWLQI